jgi:hypothetical protein
MGADTKKAYRRSWRNLLLDSSYQLRFTLFMVGTCAVLMTLLGVWVMRVAERATTVAINNVLGARCKEPRPAQSEPGVERPDPAAAAAAAPQEQRVRPVVTIDDSQMPTSGAGKSAPAGPAVASAELTRYESCLRGQAARIDELHHGHRVILVALVVMGGLLMIGLFLYGIKMTHRVAGPLHKVTLYFDKLREGRHETIHDLRKGDQLLAFYEHFKEACAGLRRMEVEDVAQLRSLLAVAERTDLASRSPELAESLAALRQILARKEASLG